MANRVHSRRILPESIPGAEIPSPRRDASPARPLGAAGAFEIINLDTHPDGKLLRACTEATKLKDGLETIGKNPFGSLDCPEGCKFLRLYNSIAQTDALTHLGLTMKAMFAMGDRQDAMEHLPAHLYASVIRDFLRMGFTS